MSNRQLIEQGADEENVILQIREGNEFVLKRVYKENFPAIKKYIVSNSGDEDDAKDLYQEAFMVFYQKVKENEFELQSSIKTYLYAVARNLWLKKLRLFSSGMIVPLKDEDDYSEVAEDVEQAEDRDNEVKHLKLALDQLGEPCKTILNDFFYHKKSMEEIAVKMNYTNSANAKNQKYKCFNRLKKLFLVESRKNNY